ncbi:hypothetical protein Bbelb_308140 [Branchiostoma belcheri]|nr:hypothetical protein Bbelb_308140 [Branchiostoma belcheri]
MLLPKSTQDVPSVSLKSCAKKQFLKELDVMLETARRFGYFLVMLQSQEYLPQTRVAGNPGHVFVYKTSLSGQSAKISRLEKPSRQTDIPARGGNVGVSGLKLSQKVRRDTCNSGNTRQSTPTGDAATGEDTSRQVRSSDINHFHLTAGERTGMPAVSGTTLDRHACGFRHLTSVWRTGRKTGQALPWRAAGRKTGGESFYIGSSLYQGSGGGWNG